jgi:hypothetical protein
MNEVVYYVFVVVVGVVDCDACVDRRWASLSFFTSRLGRPSATHLATHYHRSHNVVLDMVHTIAFSPWQKQCPSTHELLGERLPCYVFRMVF